MINEGLSCNFKFHFNLNELLLMKNLFIHHYIVNSISIIFGRYYTNFFFFFLHIIVKVRNSIKRKELFLQEINSTLVPTKLKFLIINK